MSSPNASGTTIPRSNVPTKDSLTCKNGSDSSGNCNPSCSDSAVIVNGKSLPTANMSVFVALRKYSNRREREEKTCENFQEMERRPR